MCSQENNHLADIKLAPEVEPSEEDLLPLQPNFYKYMGTLYAGIVVVACVRNQEFGDVAIGVGKHILDSLSFYASNG